MSNNPQQDIQNTGKKLRPIKLSDEKFELFYKEIYAEFGPKDVPPVEVYPQVKEIVVEPQEEEIPQMLPVEAVEEELFQDMPLEEPAQDIPVENVAEELTLDIPEEPAIEEAPQEISAEPVEVDSSEAFPMEPVCASEEEPVQEDAAKAAAVVCDVQEDEVILEEENAAKPKKSRAVPALIAILCLEAVAIAGLAAYWLLQMS